MRIYSIWALLKVLLGMGILWTIYHFVHVYEQPVIGLSLWFLWVFLSMRGGSYFFFFVCYKLFSQREEVKKSSESYTHSLLLALWVMIQLTLMITDNRAPRIAFASLLVFVFLHRAVIYDGWK